MKRVLKTILRIGVIGSASCILAACYGVMETFTTYTFTIKDETTEAAIPNLKVELISGDSTVGTSTTDADGKALISTQGGADEVKITDVDGTDNGSYPETTKTIDTVDTEIRLSTQ